MIAMRVKKLLQFSTGLDHLEVNMTIERGKFLSVYGNSGAGKTTLLRMLAGLTTPDSGTISADNNLWFDTIKNINVKPQQRNIGFVFQDFALFPNMTVKQNLLYALPNRMDKDIADQLLEITGLHSLAHRPTYQLSGGQQQRVALARALVRKPELLLLDEPLSSLDHETKLRLQDEIMGMHKRFNLTTILISHDKEEILKLSDYVVKLDQGKIIKQGTGEEVFPEETSNCSILMQGIVSRVSHEGLHSIVDIISGDQTNSVQVLRTQTEHLKAGDQIVARADAAHVTIKKLSESGWPG